MNTRILFILIMAGLACKTLAQNDTMYIMKNGNVIGKYNVNTQIDSIVFSKGQTIKYTLFMDTRDGQVYRTVIIGNQVWMAENLKYLPSVIESSYGSETVRYYYVFGYEGISVPNATQTDNYKTYGVLYNWMAAMDGGASSNLNPGKVQGVCPSGWHLPSDSEWTQLTDYLGGEAFSGDKLKETGTDHWKSPHDGATNETGFTGLPGGYRFYTGMFLDIEKYTYWWSATENDAHHAWQRGTVYYMHDLRRTYDYKETGASVRCIRD
jgi:uncharacterized protein (TIGR02145 family)